MIPTFFCIGVLVWLGLRELRKWFEALIKAGSADDSERDGKEELPDSVKHMYN